MPGVLLASESLNSLLSVGRRHHYQARSGQPGHGGNKSGRSADDLMVAQVPRIGDRHAQGHIDRLVLTAAAVNDRGARVRRSALHRHNLEHGARRWRLLCGPGEHDTQR